ncbi:MAG TPA: serine hydrolase domain-containing protein, partial [Pyrinomonadaceae bacterium]|nr:serine hydrolase domain-containing protein [Pyrinomonadaceae bacterium]
MLTPKLIAAVVFSISITTATNLAAAQAKIQNSASPDQSRLLPKLQARLDEARIKGKFPGAQVGFALLENDGTLRSGSVATGVADLQTAAPLKISDRLLASSIGKTFVAAVTLLLVQEGKLELDAHISKWLTNEKWFSQLPNAQEITLRMLLNHSSGLPNHVDVSGFQKAILKSGSVNIKYDELVKYILNKKPLFPAGGGYNYSDTNYILVGMIVEKVTGKSLYEGIHDRLLTPNGLEHITPSNSSHLIGVANGYLEGKPVIINDKFTINPQWEWAGGGFAANAEDLARWASLLYGGKVLSASGFEQMIKSTTVNEGAGYGLGVMLSENKWGKGLGHDGEFPGYLSEVRYYPTYHLAVSVMVNSDETTAVSRFVRSAVDDFAGII